MQQAVTQLPPAVSRFGAQLENLLSKIEYERRTAQLRVDTSAKKGPPAQKSRPKASDAKFGRWKPVGSLPEGGQAHILLVEDSEKEFPGRWVLKRLKNISDEVRRARFQREVDVTRSLKHPNILKVIDSDLGAARPYFVAEYCPGGSLEHATRYTGDIRATVKVLGPIVDALVEAHKQKVFHRDIKPANLFLREDGSPVIGDFGICFAEDGLSLTVSSEGVGSRNFIAPEMETGRHGLGDPSDRTDVYSVGKVIYYMLAGGRVFAREDHRKISLVDLLGNQKFEHVHELLDKMIVEYPANRLSSREVNERLKAAEALVEGNFATLIPSIGIQCRFCGIGNYAILDRQQARPARPGLQPTFPTEVGVLRCPHCGHVEIFALNETESGDWFSR
jgi:serine/threonine protein kinase